MPGLSFHALSLRALWAWAPSFPCGADPATSGLAGRHPHVQILPSLWECLQAHLMHLVYHDPATIKPHCKWLYIVTLEAQNDFVNIKIIGFVICLWIEKRFLPPPTVYLFRPNLSPSADRSVTVVLSFSALQSHPNTGLTPAFSLSISVPIHPSASCRRNPPKMALIWHNYSWASTPAGPWSFTLTPPSYKHLSTLSLSFLFGHWKTSVVLKN